METKHTQGNWNYHKRPDAENSKIPFAIQIDYNGACRPIADICAFPPLPEQLICELEANAKLIAAAPDLLAELIKAHNLLKSLKGNLFIGSDFDIEIESAIKKATE